MNLLSQPEQYVKLFAERSESQRTRADLVEGAEISSAMFVSNSDVEIQNYGWEIN